MHAAFFVPALGEPGILSGVVWAGGASSVGSSRFPVAFLWHAFTHNFHLLTVDRIAISVKAVYTRP